MHEWEKHARDIQCAEAEGLTRSTDGSWSCPICWTPTIQTYNLEQHMCSNYHSNFKSWENHRISLETKKANGELPWWMDIKGYHEYCTICQKRAPPSHVSSDAHTSRIKNAEVQRGLTHESSDGSGTLTISPPSHWGDPTLYKWVADSQAFWCMLCWKWADDNHVNSTRHISKLAWMPHTSNCCLQEKYVMPPPPPPPPPLFHHGAYTVASTSQPLPGVQSAGDDEGGDFIGYKSPSSSYPAQTFAPPGLSQSGYASDDDRCQSSDACCVKPALPPKSSLKQIPPSNPGWVRYVHRSDDANPIFWWNCDNGNCFLESKPEPWSKHRHTHSDKDYWLNSNDDTWFYAHSGSMDVIDNVKNAEKKVHFYQ